MRTTPRFGYGTTPSDMLGKSNSVLRRARSASIAGGGEASTVKMHPECYDAMQEAAREEGGYIEWTPGMERPLPANAKSEGADAASSRTLPLD